MDEIPALSPSVAQTLLSESPLHAWTRHRLLGNMPKPETEATRSGRIYHKLLLEDSMDDFHVCDFRDWRTKASQEERQWAKDHDLTPILKREMDHIQYGVERIRERLRKQFRMDLRNGRPEVRLEWKEPSLRGEILCHGHVDLLSDDHRQVVELKTGRMGITEEACSARLVREGGAIQAAAYRSAIEKLHPEVAGRIQVRFVFAEIEEPYAVVAGTCAGTLEAIGSQRWMRAIETWARCLHDDHWPGPVERLTTFHAPAWAIAQEMEIAGEMEV